MSVCVQNEAREPFGRFHPALNYVRSKLAQKRLKNKQNIGITLEKEGNDNDEDNVDDEMAVLPDRQDNDNDDDDVDNGEKYDDDENNDDDDMKVLPDRQGWT